MPPDTVVVSDAVRYDDAPFSTSTTSNWVASVGGLPPYIRAVARGVMRSGHSESEAIQIALGVMANWISSPKTSAETKAKATEALAHWEAMKAAAHAGGKRDFLGETTPGGAGFFLPAGPSKKQDEDISDTLTKQTHRFKGTDLSKCEDCGKPILSSVHTIPATEPGQPIPPVPRMVRAGAYLSADEMAATREAGERTLEGLRHARGHAARHAAAAYAENTKNFAQVEGPLEDAMRAHFQDQRTATINRLTGKRGKQTLRKARLELERRAESDTPPATPEEAAAGTAPVEPEGGPAPSIAPGAIFDASFWAAKTAGVIKPHLATAGALAANAVKNQLGIGTGIVDDTSSLGAVNAILDARANAAAQYITGTTAKQLADALQQGVANGEGMVDIAKRVNDVFDEADIVRAKQIAQTQTVGAYNEGATTYAQGLPEGVVGSHRWLSHKDARTRPTHRLADGQEQPIDQPFFVGGYPMMHPGDQSAPIGEWINCRCNTAFLPSSMAGKSLLGRLSAVPA